MSSVVSTYGTGYAASASSEAFLYLRRKGQPSGEGKAVVLLHGRQADALQYIPAATSTSIGFFAHWLALEGYRVLSIDGGGQTAWGNSASVSRVGDAVTYLAAQGANTTKVGVMGYSMGALTALNWSKRNASAAGPMWLWAPHTDLDWSHTNQDATHQSEQTAAFGGNYANSAGYRVGDEKATWAGLHPIKIVHGSSDTTVPPSLSTAFATGVGSNASYSAVAGDHLTLFSSVDPIDVVSFFKNNF